jgi:hypothetical protein
MKKTHLLKSKLHFETVPLELVKRILGADISAESPPRNGHQKHEKDSRSARPSSERRVKTQRRRAIALAHPARTGPTKRRPGL